MQKSNIARNVTSVFVLSTLVLGVSFALAARPTPSQESPLQVANTLDGVVQPRFQKTMGRFGIDRVMLGAHTAAYDLLSSAPAEKRALQKVYAAHRPFALGFLHCARRPGAGAFGKGDTRDGHAPWTATLVAAGTSPAAANKTFQWASAHLDKIVLPKAAALRRGVPQQATSGNWVVVMRPVLASSRTCLSCHAGAHVGDTLGAMLYIVDTHVMPTEPRSLRTTGEGDN